MLHKFHNDWNEILSEELKKDYYQALNRFITDEYHTKTIYPDKNDIFNAFHYTCYKDIKVVLLGQDP